MFSFFKSRNEKNKASEPPVPVVEDIAESTGGKTGWAARLKAGLTRTRENLNSKLGGVFSRGRIDDDLYDELETVLLTADVGVTGTERLLKDLRALVKKEKLTEAADIKPALQSVLLDLLQPLEAPLDVNTAKPFVIMLAGVNGAGKTTTIGKLAKLYQSQGKTVLLAAG
ncbi:MAG: signal recognition particle receptor subunit alpha, partial [Burkholderiales bacterium]